MAAQRLSVRSGSTCETSDADGDHLDGTGKGPPRMRIGSASECPEETATATFYLHRRDGGVRVASGGRIRRISEGLRETMDLRGFLIATGAYLPSR
ncbi:hypothetical protein Mal4_07490 [Maioricimonas rarisocia]|uniref:Uncharacterized protein n=1 Tax=Maioricimonas rarisocia TaxID=2528026 RepID=A0A517Z1W0_9PLAN|nr:hypothetical protein Mal4_07490 [Maioricimonas rarisocia]